MKLVPLVLAAALQIFLFVALMNFGAKPTPTELEELNRITSQRDERRQLIEFLIAEEAISEGTDGTIQLQGDVSAHAQDAIIEENLNRKRLFELLARQQERTPESIGQEFHQRRLKKHLAAHGTEAPIGHPAPAPAPSFSASLPTTAVQVPTVPVVAPGTRTETIGLPLHRSEIELRIQGDAAMIEHVFPDLIASYLKGQDAREIVPMFDSTGRSVVNYTSASNRPEAIVLVPVVGEAETGDLRLVDVDQFTADQAPLPEAAEGAEPTVPHPTPTGPVAHDALVVVVNPGNPLAKISSEELASIFSGQVKFWNSLVDGDARGMIHPACNLEDHAAFQYFNRRVLAPADREISTSEQIIRGNDRDIVRTVAGDANAIGVVAYSAVPPELDVKVVRVSESPDGTGIFPSLYSIRYGSYPLARKFVVETVGEASGAAVELANYARSAQGEDALNQFLLLTGEILAEERAPEQAPERKALAEALEVRRLKALESGFAPADYLSLINKANRDRSPSDLYFAAAEAESPQITMDETSQMELLKIVDRLALMGDSAAQVHLIGFSDSTGSEDYNLKLSKSRAKLAADFLKQFGITKVTHHGFGETLPIADNDSEIGRNRNRRVEVWVTPSNESLVTMRN